MGILFVLKTGSPGEFLPQEENDAIINYFTPDNIRPGDALSCQLARPIRGEEL